MNPYDLLRGGVEEDYHRLTIHGVWDEGSRRAGVEFHFYVYDTDGGLIFKVISFLFLGDQKAIEIQGLDVDWGNILIVSGLDYVRGLIDTEQYVVGKEYFPCD